jgi:hypothetical protein
MTAQTESCGRIAIGATAETGTTVDASTVDGAAIADTSGTAADIEQDVRRRFATASRRAGRRFRVDMSIADKAGIHAAELRRVGVRDPRFAAEALVTMYAELDHIEPRAGRGRSRRPPAPRPRWRDRRQAAATAVPQ